ncbi:ATP synthase F1 subunit delta [Acidobacterium sp. S8]|uniref:ATP synthase F1 subunit delta n=1 Tax=Acidobacterium sp. S8 TaxID=1641854 RepID=UPI00131ECD96|nr:ATP synthase F1 subunit delta [Acidobacterium sp. S8]
MAAIAAPYARAFAAVVFEAHLNPNEVQQQLDDFVATWKEGADLREIFLDPSFAADQKVGILDKLNTRLGMSQLVRNFIAVLIQHDRLNLLDEVLAEYRKEVNRRLGISEVQVTTARPLADDERKSIEQKVAEMTGTQVQATYHEDKSLLGGVVVRVGSTVYDGSVKGKLDQLKEQLAS